jgi:hypothetical protein
MAGVGFYPRALAVATARLAPGRREDSVHPSGGDEPDRREANGHLVPRRRE